MEVKEAVKTAKKHIRSLFDTESISNVGLEEVELDDGEWTVTIGFSRPWDFVNNAMRNLSGEYARQNPPRRSYKVVCIEDVSGRVVSVKNHPVETSL